LGLAGAYWLIKSRAATRNVSLPPQQLSDLIVYAAFGVFLGGRLGYVLFYNLPFYLDHPLKIFAVWEGGMSFHGGLIGVLLAMWLFSTRLSRPFFQLTDFLAPLIPIGLATGRLGNFINGELWGAPADVPWAMRVSCERFYALCRDKLLLPSNAEFTPPLHPTQLYESLLEGVLLFSLLWFFSSKPRPMMAVSGLFLLGYGVFRFGVEFLRLPDAHIGYLAFGWLTMGQLLTLPMLAAGLVLLVLAYRKSIGAS
jgi:phosphatidylglycerol:prolipoprotein diacylglycerol transferase